MTRESPTLETASFVGMPVGIGLLIVALFAEELRVLAVPALVLLFPSLLYGMR